MKKPRVLLVDDEEIVLVTLAYDLTQKGYSVRQAGSGGEALEVLKNDDRFDLVISDLCMEGIGGLEVLQKAKKIHREIIVIILTGYGDMKSAIQALRLGADDYLLKPCDTEELDLRMANCLERREARRKIQLYEKILPVCCVCGLIRDDAGVEQGKGPWLTSAEFFVKKTVAAVTHTYCPVCFAKAMEENCP